MVKVEGSAFHRLLDFILTNKTILYGDGRLANIPPTLLAPNQFLGATLHMLKVMLPTLCLEGHVLSMFLHADEEMYIKGSEQ